MGINVNCKHWDKFTSCNKKPKVFFGLFKQSCIEYVSSLKTKCEIAEKYLKPPIVLEQPVEFKLIPELESLKDRLTKLIPVLKWIKEKNDHLIADIDEKYKIIIGEGYSSGVVRWMKIIDKKINIELCGMCSWHNIPDLDFLIDLAWKAYNLPEEQAKKEAFESSGLTKAIDNILLEEVK